MLKGSVLGVRDFKCESVCGLFCYAFRRDGACFWRRQRASRVACSYQAGLGMKGSASRAGVRVRCCVCVGRGVRSTTASGTQVRAPVHIGTAALFSFLLMRTWSATDHWWIPATVWVCLRKNRYHAPITRSPKKKENLPEVDINRAEYSCEKLLVQISLTKISVVLEDSWMKTPSTDTSFASLSFLAVPLSLVKRLMLKLMGMHALESSFKRTMK